MLLSATAVMALIVYSAFKTHSDFANLCFGFTVIESIFETGLSARDSSRAKRGVKEDCQKYDLSTEENIRRVQDRILEYRRTPAILVPDALYTLKRKQNEKKGALLRRGAMEAPVHDNTASDTQQGA